jgi:hypothetical protein
MARSYNSKFINILLATVGIVFLGSPLRSGPELTTAAQWFLTFQGMFMESNPSQGVRRDLEQSNGVLRDLLEDFAKTAREPWLRLELRCFYELRRTEKKGFKSYVGNPLQLPFMHHISYYHFM